MFLIINNNKEIDKILNNINIVLHTQYNFYHIYYDTNIIQLSGIPLRIEYNNIIEKNDRYFIYFKDNIINYIDQWFSNNIDDFYFIRKDINNQEKYIIGNIYKDINSNYIDNFKIDNKNKELDIIIYKIKYIKGKYIPIINII